MKKIFEIIVNSHRNRKIVLNFSVFIIFLLLISNVYCEELNTIPKTSQLLKQLNIARSQSLNISECLDLYDNPAYLEFSSRSQLNFSIIRLPQTKTYVMFPSIMAEVGKETHVSYVSNANSIETLEYFTPLGKLGSISLELILSQSGEFSRVNSEGKSINEFPENDLLLIFGYAKKISNTSLGMDAKFIRSKKIDQEREKTFIRGFMYDIGLMQKIGNFTIGGIWRNLSNGLSAPTNSSLNSRFELRDSFNFGIEYKFIPLQNVVSLLGLEITPPFKNGFRGNLLGVFCYRNWLDLKFGYVRDVSDNFILENEIKEIDYFKLNSLEKIDGFTFGVGLRINRLKLDFAFIPMYKLLSDSEDFKILKKDNNNYTFSLSASYGF